MWVLFFGAITLITLWYIIDLWKREDPRFSFLIMLLCIVNVISTLCILYFTNVIGSRAAGLYKYEENHYLTAKGYVLGKYLADKHPGGTVLIIAAPDYKKDEDFATFLKGLKKAFGKKITVGAIEGIVITKNIKPGGHTPALWRVMQAVDFDSMINRHPECNIVLTTIGLPEDLHRMNIWQQPDKTRPKLAIIGGHMFVLWKAIKAGYISAAIAGVTGKINYDSPPDDLEKTFAKRYILVTKENLDEMMKKYKTLFFLN